MSGLKKTRKNLRILFSVPIVIKIRNSGGKIENDQGWFDTDWTLDTFPGHDPHSTGNNDLKLNFQQSDAAK
jgi:hypothetical protein